MKKILIVEDDQIVTNIYRNKFSVEGYKVESAADGQVGLEMVHNFRPDAVILDLMLPKITGVELIKKIRSEDDFRQLPIIVFSNTYLTNLVQEAWKAGATRCLSKANCTPKQIIDVLRTALSNNGSPVVAPTPGTVPQTPAPLSPAAVAATPAPSETEAEFQAGLRKSFLEGMPTSLSALRVLLQGMIKAENETVRLKQVHELYRRIHSITANAGMTGLHQIARMADALEALLKELYEKPKNLNASTLRTVASAIDFLGILFEKRGGQEKPGIPPAEILVVDDEAISRRAVTYALEKAKLKCVSVEDSAAAYGLLVENSYDLIFLDVDMPGMNGFELCTKLRTLPGHKKTPVVFVTSLNDFESRTSSTMSGGNDLIAKPFLFMELAVKALVYILRARVNPAK
jgi:DNA-binding response OmpR family regulator